MAWTGIIPRSTFWWGIVMKNAIFALLVAFALAATFIGYASISFAGGSNVDGSYIDNQSGNPVP
jgi:hypothetical protein